MSQHPIGHLPTVRYHLGMERPHTHLFQVEIHVPAWPGEHLDLAMPAWTPGAYKIVDNARNVRGFKALGPDGRPLAVDRVDLHTWRVHHGGSPFSVRYQVFGDKMTIHQAQLNASHAFINGCAVFLYVVGGQGWPAELTIQGPEGWKIGTALEALGANRFQAPSYDDLIDCPIEMGHFQEARFEVAGAEYRIVWNGVEPMDKERLIDGLRRIAEAEVAFWGQAPYSTYTFVYNVTTDPYLNGLEHKTSTAIQGPINLDKNAKGFFALSAHELFHVWNVKRLRPVGLGPFDYSKPAHTTALWVVEGLTEYYTELMCLRAGIQSPEEYLKAVADNLVHLEQSPGRRFTTLEEASFVTWQFGDDRWNGYVNYYLKGFMMGVALDLEIRERTGNRKSLDDVMRLLWDRYGAPDLPYVPEEVEHVVEEVVGASMEAFFEHHLRTTDDTDWRAVFAKAGLKLSVAKETASLQARTSAKEGGLAIEDVRYDGAAQQAGLQSGDQIVAIDGVRASEVLLGRLGHNHRPGDRVLIQYVRQNQLCEATLTLGGDRTYALTLDAEPTPLQASIVTAWLRHPAVAEPALA